MGLGHIYLLTTTGTASTTGTTGSRRAEARCGHDDIDNSPTQLSTPAIRGQGATAFISKPSSNPCLCACLILT